ncbi:MAG: hypothetical protein IIA45_03975 [Bacteroidetes bacterium]|nr:hypothetical protein [Bacteroidota bacterium]
MKTHLTYLLLLITLSVSAQYNWDNLGLLEETQVNELYTFQSLRLYPILANQVFEQAHQNVGNYVTLKEALEQDKVLITEMSAIIPTATPTNGTTGEESQQIVRGGARVNTLFIENTSMDTIYLMAGEVIKGGKQNRVIAQDVLIPPSNGEKVDLSVFCVEHGRWSYSDNDNDGIPASFGIISNATTVQTTKVIDTEKDQSKVWDSVRGVMSKNDAVSGTGTYTALEDAEEFKAELNGYLAHFENFASSFDNMIGVVVVCGSNIVCLDMFATKELFRKEFSGLLISYATEAITNGEDVKIFRAEVVKYLDKVLNDEDSQEEIVEQSGKIFKSGKTKMHVRYY